MHGRCGTGRVRASVEALERRQLLTAVPVAALPSQAGSVWVVGETAYYTVATSEGAQLQQRDAGGHLRAIRPADGHRWHVGGHGYGVRVVGAGRNVFALANDDAGGRLWQIDQRTLRATPLTPPSIDVSRSEDIVIGLNDTLLFGAGTNARELWRSDGTPAGTFALTQPSSGQSSSPLGATRLGDQVYFTARTAASSWQLFKTDGTLRGTRQVSDFAGSVRKPVAAGSRLYFSASRQPGESDRIWFGDGTRAGSRQVSGEYGADASHRIAVGSYLFFTASTPDAGREIWVADGASARRVTDLERGPANSITSFTSNTFLALGSSLYFSTYDIRPSGGGHAGELPPPPPRLWRIDTRNFRPTILFNGEAQNLLAFNNKVYFTHFARLHVTDGTRARTESLDLPTRHMAASDQRLYMAPHTPQLWAIDPTRGSIHGTAWNDRNGNGVFDPTEEVLSNSRVFIDRNGDGRFNRNEPSTRTDAKGAWSFRGLSPGTYTVMLTSPGPGWSHTTPGAQTSQVRADEVTRHHFGVRGAAGTISGSILRDDTGTMSPISAGAAGFRIFLDYDDDGVLDKGEPLVRSDAQGRFNFASVPAGNYWLRVTEVSGWRATTALRAKITLDPAGHAKRSFGLTQNLLVSGHVYHRRSTGLFGLRNVRVYADLNDNGSLDAGEPSVLTDAQGAYRIVTLPAGSYVLRTTDHPGYAPSDPTRPAKVNGPAAHWTRATIHLTSGT